MGLSPLHARTTTLLDTVDDEYHQCKMSNFYYYDNFNRAGYNLRFKVLCHGVKRIGGYSLLPSVLWKYLKREKEQLEYHSTMKSAVLKGDPKWPNIMALSVYDRKPVQYISMVLYDLKWIFPNKYDLFHPKTFTFSTHALIWVHFKTVRYFSQPIFSIFSHFKNALHKFSSLIL